MISSPLLGNTSVHPSFGLGGTFRRALPPVRPVSRSRRPTPCFSSPSRTASSIQSSASMRIHVVGIGAVGNFVAFHLRQSLHPRHSVVALHRSETAKLISDLPNGAPLSIERDGTLFSQDGLIHLPYGEPRNRVRRSDFAPARIDARDDPVVREAIGPIDSLIVTSKAFAVRTIMRKLRHNLSRDSTIVLLHNGMGVYETVIQDVYPDPNDRPNFVLCSNTHGLYSKGPLHSVHSAVGDIKLGIVPDPLGRRNYEASYAAASRPANARLSLDDLANVSTEQPTGLATSTCETLLPHSYMLLAFARPGNRLRMSTSQCGVN